MKIDSRPIISLDSEAMVIVYYCVPCGEEREVPISLEWTCPECDTIWALTVEGEALDDE